MTKRKIYYFIDESFTRVAPVIILLLHLLWRIISISFSILWPLAAIVVGIAGLLTGIRGILGYITNSNFVLVSCISTYGVTFLIAYTLMVLIAFGCIYYLDDIFPGY